MSCGARAPASSNVNSRKRQATCALLNQFLFDAHEDNSESSASGYVKRSARSRLVSPRPRDPHADTSCPKTCINPTPACLLRRQRLCLRTQRHTLESTQLDDRVVALMVARRMAARRSVMRPTGDPRWSVRCRRPFLWTPCAGCCMTKREPRTGRHQVVHPHQELRQHCCT